MIRYNLVAHLLKEQQIYDMCYVEQYSCTNVAINNYPSSRVSEQFAISLCLSKNIGLVAPMTDSNNCNIILFKYILVYYIYY